jgi:hypothetical protein
LVAGWAAEVFDGAFRVDCAPVVLFLLDGMRTKDRGRCIVPGPRAVPRMRSS